MTFNPNALRYGSGVILLGLAGETAASLLPARDECEASDTIALCRQLSIEPPNFHTTDHGFMDETVPPSYALIASGQVSSFAPTRDTPRYQSVLIVAGEEFLIEP